MCCGLPLHCTGSAITALASEQNGKSSIASQDCEQQCVARDPVVADPVVNVRLPKEREVVTEGRILPRLSHREGQRTRAMSGSRGLPAELLPCRTLPTICHCCR